MKTCRENCTSTNFYVMNRALYIKCYKDLLVLISRIVLFVETQYDPFTCVIFLVQHLLVLSVSSAQ
jgi:hypothetical protein